VTTSVIVLSHRPGEWLVRCLESLTTQADEVVLVDNASPNGEASTIGAKAGVMVIRSPTNRGFAGGVNLGLSHATGDVVALLNDDAVAGAGWLRSASELLEDPAVAAVTPKVRLDGWWREVVLDDPAWFAPGDARPLGRQVCSVTVDGTDVLGALGGAGIHQLEHQPDDDSRRWRWTAGARPFYVPLKGPDGDGQILVDGTEPPPGPRCRLINNAGSFLRLDGYLGDHGLEAPDDGRFDDPAERFSASGTALVARAATFARLGGLAEPYFAYYEDSDWSWRARLAGLRLVYDPRTSVEHRRSATSGGVSDPWVHRLGERNRLLTVVRNAPGPVAARLVGRRLREGPDQGIRRAVLARLPWALATRAALSRRWELRPAQVWERWAGAGVTWDDGPCRTGS
jgi:GT2 family glycosyltransferase